jgi:hypothetical protein
MERAVVLACHAQLTNGRCPALARACAATATGGSCWFPTAELYNVDGIGGVGAAMPEVNFGFGQKTDTGTSNVHASSSSSSPIPERFKEFQKTHKNCHRNC